MDRGEWNEEMGRESEGIGIAELERGFLVR